jgi:hypothetical protein
LVTHRAARAAELRRRGVALAAVAGSLLLAASSPAPCAAAPSARSLIERRQLTVGEPAEWVIVLDNAGTIVPEPEFTAPEWARIDASGTSRNVSFVNGKLSSSVSYRFVVVPARTGRHTLPAVSFQIGRDRLSADPLAVDVIAAAPIGRLGDAGAREGGASRLRLVASVAPAQAIAGEPLRLVVRFYQGVRLLADPQYRAPDVQGFWAENPSPPRSYYAESGGRRWLVTETQTVIYPTISGRLRIGPARMRVVVADADGGDFDPLDPRLGRGGRGGETVDLASPPLVVDVAAPPAAGRPASYAGAVGEFTLTLRPERTRLRADETLNLTVRLHGTGNLRLAPPPGWAALHDFEVYGHSARDSIDLGGAAPSGTKIVEWSLLPRRQGRLTLPAILYSTYVPGSGYRVLSTPPLAIQVAAPINALGGASGLIAEGVPRGLWRPPGPWGGIVFGLLAAGLAVFAAASAVRARRGAPLEAARALSRRRAALAAAARDPHAFHAEAERLLTDREALPAGGADEENARRLLLDRVRGARYAPGGGEATPAAVAEMLDRFLERRAAASRRQASTPWGWIAVAVSAAAIAVAAAAWAGWRIGDGAPGEATMRAWRAAFERIEAGDGGRAEAQLEALWRGGWRGGPLAAQAALSALVERRLGAAALWAERARREAPRDPFVRRVRRALDEEGALPGHPEGLGTLVRWQELLIGAAALFATGVLALAVAVLWPRTRRVARIVAAALALVALGAAATAAGVSRAGFGSRGAVLLEAASLRAGPGGAERLDLEPGRLLEWRRDHDGWIEVGLGGGLSGWIPAGAVARVVDRSGARAASD